MLVLLPFTYVFLCLLCAFTLSKVYAVGFWLVFGMSVMLTPFVVFVASVFFPKHPRAYCMSAYDTFRVGENYAYKVRSKNGSQRIVLYHNGTFEVSEHTFNQHFSLVLQDGGKRSSSRFKGVV